MAPGKKNPPPPDDAEKGSRDEEKEKDSPVAPPPPPRRARSRGGRTAGTPAETVGVKASAKVAAKVSGSDADASLHWGVRKTRGADPSRLPRGDASNRPVEKNLKVPKPAPRPPNPESVGFESLLQLADAGVQLEKRRSGAAAAAARRRARAEAETARAKKNVPSKRAAPPTLAGKRRGRGPNKVQETEEEREAKRLRRVQANRESARQTIRRKHEMYDDLSGRAGALEKTNKSLREEVATLFGEMRALAATNASLRDDIKTAARAKGVPEPDVGDGAAAKEAAAAATRTPDVLADASGRTAAVAAAAAAAAKAMRTPATAPIAPGQPSFPAPAAPIPGAAAMPAMPGAPMWPPFPGLAFAPGPGPGPGPGPASGPAGGTAPPAPYFVNGAPALAFFHPAAMAATGFAGWPTGATVAGATVPGATVPGPPAATPAATPATAAAPTGTDAAPAEATKVAAAAAARMQRRAKVSSASK